MPLTRIKNTAIGDGGISTAKLADGAVTTVKVADSAVNSAKIGVDVIAAEDLAANSVTVSEISDGAVTGAKLADNLNYDSGTLYLDSTNNRIGIGTTSPSAKLELNNGSAGSLVTFTDGINTNFNFSTINLLGIFGTDAGSTSLAFKTSGSERGRIDSVGRFIFNSNHTYSNTPFAGYSGVIQVGSDGTVHLDSYSSGGGTNLAFGTNTGAGAIQEVMRLAGDGKVGIGTTAPTKKVSANIGLNDTDGYVLEYSGDAKGGILLNPNSGEVRMGAINSSGTYFTTFYSNATEHMRIDSTGRVGIGVSNPVTPLQVQNDSDTDYSPSAAAFNNILNLKNNTSGALNNSIISFTTESNGEWYIGGVQNNSNNASDFVFASRDSGARAERVMFTSTGKINTSNRNYGLLSHSTGVSFADNTTMNISAGTAGGGILVIYNANSGRHATFGVGYGAVYLIGQSHSGVYVAGDVDGKFGIYSGGGHTFTLVNRLGSTAGFIINLFMAGSTAA
jgi:hypothetical protein